MNYEAFPTDVLLAKYFHAELVIDDLIPGDDTLADVATMLLELDDRGVCVRDVTPPEWYQFYADPANRETVAPRV